MIKSNFKKNYHVLKDMPIKTIVNSIISYLYVLKSKIHDSQKLEISYQFW